MKLGGPVRGLRILHIALTASIAMYGLVAYFVTQQHHKPTAGVDPKLLGGIFAACALGHIVATIIVRKKLLPPVPEGAPATDPIDAVEVTEPMQRALDAVRRTSIITWALCEGIALYGLVLAFLFYDVRYFAPFGFAAITAMAIYAPGAALFDRIVRAR